MYSSQHRFGVGQMIYFCNGDGSVERDTVQSIIIEMSGVTYHTECFAEVRECDAFATPAEAFDALDRI